MAPHCAEWLGLGVGSLLLVACSGLDSTLLPGPDLPGVAEGTTAFLGFPERAEAWADSPPLLSQTLAFQGAASAESRSELRFDLSMGLLPYSVQSPLFSDGAEKRRWLALPSGTQIGFAKSGAWSFPEGTVLVKEFDLALDEREPTRLRRLETRFLIVARAGRVYGLSYVWNDAQTDAELRADSHDEVLTTIGADGTVGTQTYTFPAQSDCEKCHSDIAGGVLGPRTAQLNGDYDYPGPGGVEGLSANQLSTWERLGFFDRVVGDRPLSEYPQLVDLRDTTKPAEQRIRSYWESNCSMCHNADSPIPSWDARYTTSLEHQGVLDAEPYAGRRTDNLLLIAPGEPERSLMLVRAISTEPLVRMPPLLRNRVDEDYVELLRSWIASLGGAQEQR
jgi:uncharacterized repeat protein (TIGR03806 family)